MLTKIAYSYYKLADLSALVQKIIALLSTTFPDHPMISSLLARLQPQLKIALQAIGSTTKQPLTEKVNAADLSRDNSYRALRDHIKAGLRRENESYRTACEALWAEFEKNGLQLFRLSQEKESTSIDSLLNDLRKPEHEGNVQTTKITGWINELDRNNQSYVKISRERSAARSDDDTVADKQALKTLKTSLDLMDSILNTMYAMNEPVGIGPVAEEISQYIREANTLAKPDKTSSSTEQEGQSD